MLESPFDFFALLLLSDIVIRGENRIIARKHQQGVDQIEPHCKPAQTASGPWQCAL